MRSRLALIPLAALLACGGGSDSTGPGGTGGPGGGGGGGGAVATTAVEMKSLAFTPAAIKVASGATVNWTNSDNTAHNVTFDAALNIGKIDNFTSGTQSLKMPSAAGTYPYTCTLHAGMAGTVQVQ